MNDWKRDDKPVVTPRLICKNVDGMVRFLREVFGATGERQGNFPVEMMIGDCLIMVRAAVQKPTTVTAG